MFVFYYAIIIKLLSVVQTKHFPFLVYQLLVLEKKREEAVGFERER